MSAEDVAARHRGELEAIVAAVTAADPALDPAVVAAAVEQVAPSRQARTRLAAFLAAHPRSLTGGGSAAPKVAGALIRVLVQAGSTALVVPRCAGCGRGVELFHTRGEHERICRACWRRSHTAPCVDCGQDRPVAARTPEGGARCTACHGRRRLVECGGCGRERRCAGRAADGRPQCTSCRRRDPRRWEPCAGCGRDRPVNARTPDGAALCGSCYQQPPGRCDGCGQDAAIASRAGGRAVCTRCYRHPRRECGRGRTRRVAVAARDGQPDLCPTCHQAPTLVCSTCGIEDLCRTTTTDRAPICFRCQLDRRLHELLTDPATGQLRAELDPLRQAMLAVDNPRTALGWLGRSPAIPVLAAMARGDAPLSHATLDAAGGRDGRAFAIGHLRGLLVAAGALPPRDRHLARLEHAVTEIAAAAHPEDRQLLRTYATWRLLRRLREDADRDRPILRAAYRARDVVAEAARFLGWLRGRGASLADCTQADLDAWLAQRPTTRRHLPGFLRWATHRRLLTGVVPPTARIEDPKHFIPADDRWALARRMLTDDTLPATDRVAGALVLLYAQTPSRIVRLTRSHLLTRDAPMRLRIGRDELVLPEPLDLLTQQLPEQQPAGIARALAAQDPWLFPGRRPGQHMHPDQLAKRLRANGIEPRAARNAALLQLAQQVPTPVLADLLGIHTTTAERWRATAGARWANYPATRLSRDLP